jgi:hypothetical protein
MQRTNEIDHICPDGTRTTYDARTLLRSWRNVGDAEGAIRLAMAGNVAHWDTPMGRNVVRPSERPDPIIPHSWAGVLARAQDTRSIWGLGIEGDDVSTAAELVRRGWLHEVGVPDYIDAPALVVSISDAGKAVLSAYESVEDSING